MSTKKDTVVVVTVTEFVKETETNARNQDIQEKMNEIRERKDLPPVDLSEENPFNVGKRRV